MNGANALQRIEKMKVLSLVRCTNPRHGLVQRTRERTKKRTSIRQLLLEHSEGKISVDYAEKVGYVVAYNNSDWDVDSSYLPKKDSYMYAGEGEFEDEIKYFSSLNDCASYNKEYNKCVLETLGTISKEIELLTLLTAQPDTDSVVLPPFNINKMFKN